MTRTGTGVPMRRRYIAPPTADVTGRDVVVPRLDAVLMAGGMYDAVNRRMLISAYEIDINTR